MENDWKKLRRGVFLVNVLAIVYDKKNKRLLIGRRENDPHIAKLSWCFPGGRPGYNKDLEQYLKREVKKKTGLNVRVVKLLFAKTYPEKRQFLSLYYLTEVVGRKECPGERFKELKWIKPKDIKKYFTTSLHPKLYAFLKKL
jgi:ADP-ribose pyrophosphatase YjhB (NUDIX family)